ncbi:phage gene 29 protein family protein [Williamsia sp.]|uniref:phage gene 29 protein family protein n=1 Tax=Williamsia sp. TaxID=1872085 RepID=UPI002F958282
MDTSHELSPELHEAIPADMHPYAYVFMHPTMRNVAPKFEPDEMNDLGYHLEQLGFQPVADCKLRYDPPTSGGVHPHNPGKWVPKTKPRPTPLPTAAELLVARVNKLPEDQRAEAIAALTESKENNE